ncbi:MAG: DUF5666 domain-containing protein [Rhizobacter sp.]
MKCLRFFRPSPAAVLPSLAALLALLTLAISGCGGVDSGGTGQTVDPAVPTTSSGRLSGFGSVIVNDIRFDDDQAQVVDDDGVVRTRADLRLGMVVDVQGTVRGNSGTGVANRIQFGNEIAGRVEAVDVANKRLVVLGQTVQSDVDTLFSGYPTGLADVQAGHLVEVNAFYDTASGIYTATRIERKVTLAQFKLRGRIANLAALPARTFTIGAAVIDYSSAAPSPPPPPPPLANGLLVRVTLNTTPVAGRWVATAVQTSQRNLPENIDARVEGYVSGFTSPASFRVAGLQVDASSPGVRLRHGVLGDLADGVRVEVKGAVHGGVLIANELDFKRGGQQQFELHGQVESVDVNTQTFVLRGVTVSWDGSTRFQAGNVNRLVAGARVDVRGAPTGGVRILAESVRFEP